MRKYSDLIGQTFDIPTKEFKIVNNELHFHKINLIEIIKIYGTPLRLSYLPKIAENIQYAEKIFNDAIRKNKYAGNYTYTYCTKSSHFRFIIEEVLSNGSHIETSSAYDISIVWSMFFSGNLSKSHYIICNGFKHSLYVQKVTELLNADFKNCLPILDNVHEIDYYRQNVLKDFKVGIRIAADEAPDSSFHTSRLGMQYNDIISFYKEKIEGTKVKLKMLHFFINTGINDTAYYWSELNRFIYKYCELKKICPDLDSFNIGGGFPVKNNLYCDYDYPYMAKQIIENIQWMCKKNHVPVPNIFTEFGNFTVGESGAVLYSVMDQKLQNDKELWYMVNGSFITHIPDIWGSNEKYILLPVNRWNSPYHKVSLGGLTCDSMDYYDSERHTEEVFLPQYDKNETLHLGFFHTGAYQEALGGYGGIQHCLIPAPKHIIIDKDKNGNTRHKLFAPEQESSIMMKILGY
ncbi:MAG: arginine decarboxylase [Ekhidna sp.]|nr:arginine decarboxylase [Ekhidna sp.]